VWKGFVPNTNPGIGKYQFGRAEGGMQLSPVVHEATPANPLPIIKACSQFKGGALVLQFNAEGYTGSLIDFFVSTNPADVQPGQGLCPGLSQVTILKLEYPLS
jgi:hypothetical protein